MLHRKLLLAHFISVLIVGENGYVNAGVVWLVMFNILWLLVI